MTWFVEPFTEPFAREALLAGLLVVASTSVAGTWVVIRGMSFLGDALAHGVLPGIALALLLGFDPLVGAAISALVMIGGINLVHRRSRVAEDTGIGLLFVGMLALGVILISRTRSYSGDLTAILFGNLLGVSTRDLAILVATVAVSAALTLGFYRSFLALSFNREKAALLGLRPGLTHAVMLGLVTLVVVASYRSVGSLLVFALLIAPPATASLTARRVPSMIGAALAYGAFAVVTGLIVSYWADTAASATVAGIAVAEFFAVMLLRPQGLAKT